MAIPAGSGRFRVLGGLQLRLPPAVEAGRAGQKKRLAALAWLAAAWPDGAPRELLATVLWPEATSERGRRNLSATLYELRQALGPVVTEAAELLSYDPTVLPCDVVEFRTAVSSGNHAAAVSAYGGPFLDGVLLNGLDEFERWTAARRDEFGRQYGAALEALAAERASERDWRGAAEWWQRLAAHEPYSARVAVQAMHALDAAGDRAAAIRHGQQHAERLRLDLDIDPSDEVVGLAESLRATRGMAGAAVARVAGPDAAEGPPAAHSGEPLPPEASEQRGSQRTAVGAGLLVLVTLAAWLVGAGVIQQVRATGGAPLLAVLPFENLGPAEEQYFTEGMTEELGARLAGVRGLRVVSAATTAAFADAAPDIGEIGRQLGVEYVVRGSVRWERLPDGGSRVRVTPELIRIADGIRLWGHVYERDVTQVFAVQGAIARAVAAELGLVLGDDTVIDQPPTTNVEAYDLFLQANAHGSRRVADASARAAIALYERALALDPEFHEARWRLVHARVWLAWLLDETGQVGLAQRDVQQLLERGEDRIEARLGRGWYLYYGERRYEEALRDFEWSRRQRPQDPEILKTIGYLQRRLGRWDVAVASMRGALELAPLDHGLSYTLAQTLTWLGRHDEARDSFERAILLAPDVPTYYGALAELHIAAGDTARAWASLRQAHAFGVEPWHGGRPYLFRRDWDEALEWLRAASPALPVLAMSRLDALAVAAGRAGNAAARLVYADSLALLARTISTGAGRDREVRGPALAFHALALTHRDERGQALSLIRQALATDDAGDAIATLQAQEAAARALTRLEQHDDALSLLESLLRPPSPIGQGDLRFDPEWDPLRHHPRFRRIAY